MQRPYLLLTGATGLVGRYLLRNLLQRGARVAVLVREEKHRSAAARVDEVMSHWEAEAGYALPRPVVVPGDLRAQNLGLETSQQQWLEAECGSVLHCAASMTFREDNRGEPFRTNVGGTEAIVQLCRDAGIRHLHYVSTAYVCGLREGRVLETELDLGQTLGNVYEQSKLRAEKIVRRADCFDQVTILRPSSVVGDSRTGYVTSLHGFYLPLQLAHLVASQIPVAEMNQQFLSTLGLRGDEGKNLVPVDWLANAMAEVVMTPSLHGNTYHLASPRAVTVQTLQQVIQEAIQRFHPSPCKSGGGFDISTYDASFRDYMSVYQSHWRDDPIFDLANFERDLNHLPCPVMDDDTLLRIAAYPIERGLNVARRGPQQTIFEAESHLATKWPPAPRNAEVEHGSIGLQVNGRGGGQWQLMLTEGRLDGFRPGLPSGNTPMMYLTSQTLQALVCGELTAMEALRTGRVVLQNTVAGPRDLLPLFEQLVAA